MGVNINICKFIKDVGLITKEWGNNLFYLSKKEWGNNQ